MINARIIQHIGFIVLRSGYANSLAHHLPVQAGNDWLLLQPVPSAVHKSRYSVPYPGGSEW
jgi:hypothetical protein